MSYDSNAQKFAAYAGAAVRVHAATGVLPSVVLAHWALETGYFTSGSFTEGNNIGGIKFVGQPQASGTLYGHAKYSTLDKGIDDYIRVLNLGYLANMRAAGTAAAQIHELDKSPYAEDPHQGSKLLNILNTYGLIGYDSGGTGGGTPTNPVGGIIDTVKDSVGALSSAETAKMAGVGLLVVALLAFAGE